MDITVLPFFTTEAAVSSQELSIPSISISFSMILSKPFSRIFPINYQRRKDDTASLLLPLSISFLLLFRFLRCDLLPAKDLPVFLAVLAADIFCIGFCGF